MVFKLGSQAPQSPIKVLQGPPVKVEKELEWAGPCPTKAASFVLVHVLGVHDRQRQWFTNCPSLPLPILNRTLALSEVWQCT